MRVYLNHLVIDGFKRLFNVSSNPLRLTPTCPFHTHTASNNNAMARVLRSSIPYRGPPTENLIEFIKLGLRRHAEQTILIDSKTRTKWTGQQIESCVSMTAKFLREEYNLKKGDVCSLYGAESDKIALLILSIISAGGVCNFLTNKSSGREINDTTTALGSKFLLSSSEDLKNLTSFDKELRDKLKIIPFDQKEGDKKSLSDFFKQGNPDSDYNLDHLSNDVMIDSDQDFAVIQFSSGTTGKPKPIPRTHKNLCHLVASVDHPELMDLKPGVVITGSLPITHRPGLWALLGSINRGSTYVIWSNLSDVEDALATIAEYKVTIFSSSLPFLSMLGNVGLKLKDKYDTSSWQHIITSGAKIVKPNLPKSLIEEFELKSLRQCFGMTESGWVFLIEMSQAKDNYLSVGHVCPGMEAIIMNRETLEMLGPNQSGEIALRGPQIFPGYCTGTPGTFNRSDFTDSGWFRIGDRGYYDENDLVFIEGRYKEVMMFENNALFFPAEIEAIIAEHPSVEGACVVKLAEVRDDYPYDIARACITLKQGCNVTEKEIKDFVSERAPAMVIGGGVKILDKFPRLQNGKVDKQALRC